MDPRWIEATFSGLAAIAALAAILVSMQANRRAATFQDLDQRLQLAIVKAQQQLLLDLANLFVSEKVYSLQIAALEKEMAGLNHRITRNTEQTTLLLEAALRAGFPLKRD